MKILAIETSCDETGIAVLNFSDEQKNRPSIEIISHELTSQIEDHQEYGGVYPSLAKRLHAQNIPALLSSTNDNGNIKQANLSEEKRKQITSWLSRHPELAERIIQLAKKGLPDVDAVSVTIGPGLEPALWVGINTARSIALLCNAPIIPVNHMYGHLISSRIPDDFQDTDTFSLTSTPYPRITLLVSGGHTEIIHQTKDEIKKIGQTRDDAAGEAFDKVGRLLGLPYPAGPHVSKLAADFRSSAHDKQITPLPRPMIDTDNFDFSFSGLKTAAVRLIDKNKPLSKIKKQSMANELESAIVDVLVSKVKKATNSHNAKSIGLGGGVSANKTLRSKIQSFAYNAGTQFDACPQELATDNAIMIALAAYEKKDQGVSPTAADIEASSRLSL